MPIRFSFDEPVTFKNGHKADPEIIGRELLRISAKIEDIKPKDVVDTARNPRNPLHPHFEWRDQIAAERYRLDQARNLLRTLRIEDTATNLGPQRAFFNISADDGHSYQRLDRVLDSDELRQIVLKQAEEDLRAFERRFAELKDICGIVRKARERVSKHIKREESRV